MSVIGLRIRKNNLALAALVALGAAPPQNLQAAVCVFTPPTGNWGVAGNWSCGVVPSGGPDSASIAAGKAVTVNSAQSVLNLSNAGNVNIDAFLLTLAGGGSTTNTGTLNVGAGPNPNNAALQVSSGHNINNTGGVINISADSVLNQFGSTITGGVINTSGTGRLVAFNSNNNFLNAVTLNGNLDMAAATGVERVTGGLTLNGAVNINNNSVLSFSGDQTLGGNGTVVLGVSGLNRALSLEGNTALTIGSNIVVRGQNGILGQAFVAGGNQTLINNGRISADVAGGTISLAPTNGSTNNGVLEAKNGGTLVLASNVIGNIGSSIAAGAGSTVLQNGVALSGVINVSGSGAFRAANSNNNFLNAVTLNGNLDMAAATGVERVTGGLTLNGAINVNNNSVLSFSGNQTLGGNGTVVLGSNTLNRALSLEGNTALTIGSNIVVRGENGSLGQVYGAAGNQTLINNGRISADVAGGTITLAPTNGSTNNGVLEAQNGGTLVLGSNVQGTSSGSFVAGAGSTVLQNGVALSGVINVSGSGAFRAANSNNNFLNAVTLNGNLDMAAATGVERVTGGLTLNGAVNVNNNSVLSFSGNQTLGGNGTVVLGSNTLNRALSLEGNTALTIGSNIVVRGENGILGQVYGAAGNQTLINNGRISADVLGGTISLAPANGSTNNGVLEAQNGGTLMLGSNVQGTSSGSFVAGAGSTVLQNGVTLSGVINTSGTGKFQAANSNNNMLNGVSFNGALDLATATGVERVVNGLTLNGAINVNNNSVLSFSGSQTLGGNGSIVLGSSGLNRVLSLEGDMVLTVGSGVTVRGTTGMLGQAYLAGGTQSIVNNGTIRSDGGGTLTVAPTTMVNNGLMRAELGTLTIQSPLSGTGTLQVDAAGVMTLANGAKTQGTLTMGTAGAALNLGSGNLTLNTDYTNAAAGSGNGFNRRAGVTGTGQIVAGGDVAQVISGANVSGGNTANATLTLGNVRVGATTFNYQVGNAGSTGPTLRGAIQTNVNGANLSDARLSGTGVTPSNYNAGAPGGDSGNLAVTFTAANAGALAPLSGQVLNLRSNFENIGDQKLNIVLAGGAAAYNPAAGNAVSPVTVANQRVGGSNTATLNISNTAAAGSFSEDLNATLGAVSGPVSGGGSVTGRVAGTNNTGSGAISVGVATGSAGLKTGSVTLNYETAGAVNGVSNGLGTASAGSQVVSVSGNVYQPAAGQLVGSAMNFGTLQVGQQVSQNLVVRNTAGGAAGFVEDLNASFGASGNSQISGSGSLNGILAGNNSSGANGTMTVTVTGATPGALNSGIAVNYTSAGAVAGTSNGLGTLAVGSENFAVNGTINAVGNVINQASPLINNPSINLGAVRVGDASPSATVSVSNQATVAPQAALNAGITSNGAPVTASGSFNLLVPGQTNNSSLQVGLNTAVAGNYTGANAGSATLSLVSDASNVGGCAPNCQLTLASQNVSVSGKVYTPAVGQAGTSVVDFGIVRVGDTVSARNITVNNTAAVTALNDTLRADLTGADGPFANGGPATGVGAGSSGQISVGLGTASAGVFSQNAGLAFSSQNADMADVSAGANAGVQLMAQVNNLANADFDLLAGSGQLSLMSDGSYLLNLGNIALGSNGRWSLQIENEVGGPADLLRGGFDLSGADDFAPSGWGQVVGLEAGQAQGGLELDFTAGQLGSFQDTIDFFGFSFNASDPDGLTQNRRLIIQANVIDPVGGTVPEPGTLALLMAAAMAALRTRRPTH